MILSLLLSWYILFIFASSSAFVLRHTIVDGATRFSLTPFLSHIRCKFIVCRDIPSKSPKAFFVPAAAIAMLYFSIVGYLRRSCSVFLSFPNPLRQYFYYLFHNQIKLFCCHVLTPFHWPCRCLHYSPSCRHSLAKGFN